MSSPSPEVTILGGIVVLAALYALTQKKKNKRHNIVVKPWSTESPPLVGPAAGGYTLNKLQMRYQGVGLAMEDEDQIVDRVGMQHFAREWGTSAAVPYGEQQQRFLSHL